MLQALGVGHIGSVQSKVRVYRARSKPGERTMDTPSNPFGICDYQKAYGPFEVFESYFGVGHAADVGCTWKREGPEHGNPCNVGFLYDDATRQIKASKVMTVTGAAFTRRDMGWGCAWIYRTCVSMADRTLPPPRSYHLLRPASKRMKNQSEPQGLARRFVEDLKR
ncbi:hypothetical protein BDN71DRAFT_1434886 [Pleurotus eryngii]|uniref:Uncharacterized protein n=1 Tax=Pleurotus eryngii TaxID=5323 RepID=A0A9P5ZMC7_PLEER|nr:hypothetical protein BDN71DRAFT_1434886 [Pleurotus eryngii]